MLNNQRGNTLLIGIIAAGVISASTMFILDRVQDTNQMSALPRIRSNMLQVELQIRSRALNPFSYSGCTSSSGFSSCRLKQNLFTNFDNKWVRVTNVSFDETNQNFHAEISDNYDKFDVKPRIIDITIPREVLTETTFSCPDSEPFFTGFDSQGRMLCRAMTASSCSAGNYLVSIDPQTLTAICSPIGTRVSCPYGQKISSFNWVGGANVSYSCVSRPVPPVNPVNSAVPTTTVVTTTITTTSTIPSSTSITATSTTFSASTTTTIPVTTSSTVTSTTATTTSTTVTTTTTSTTTSTVSTTTTTMSPPTTIPVTTVSTTLPRRICSYVQNPAYSLKPQEQIKTFAQIISEASVRPAYACTSVSSCGDVQAGDPCNFDGETFDCRETLCPRVHWIHLICRCS